MRRLGRSRDDRGVLDQQYGGREIIQKPLVIIVAYILLCSCHAFPEEDNNVGI